MQPTKAVTQELNQVSWPTEITQIRFALAVMEGQESSDVFFFLFSTGIRVVCLKDVAKPAKKKK